MALGSSALPRGEPSHIVLLPRREGIAGQITDHVLRLGSESTPAGAADAVQLVRHSTDQNIGAMVAAFGVPSSPHRGPGRC